MSQGPAPSSPSATIRNLRSPGSRRPPNRLGKVLSLSINYQLKSIKTLPSRLGGRRDPGDRKLRIVALGELGAGP